jgi:hypothetical protein
MELNKYTRSILAQLTRHNYTFEQISQNKDVALNDIMLGSHCSIIAIRLVKNIIPRKGDILIGFYALEPVSFTLKVDELLPYHVHALRLCLGSREPRRFEPINHIIPKNRFVFACSTESNDYVINMTGMQYNSITTINGKCNKMNMLCFYGYLQTEERKNLAVSGEPLIYAFPSLRNRMAVTIQRQWRTSISDPSYVLCKSRLLHEFKQM